MDDSALEAPNFFISRAGEHLADVAFASKIGQILEKAGYRVTLQQWDFANRNFMERIDAALGSGTRVIAVLTPEYLASDYCAAEWMHALHGDPLNKLARLIILRCAECAPSGLLRTIAYWDLVTVRDRDDLLADIVNAAVMPDAERRQISVVGALWRQARPLIHDAIKPTLSFTGREDALQQIGNALSADKDSAAAITQPAAVTGLGGIGKSTLAREYAWQAQEDYAGVWWLNAERIEDAEVWEGVEHGLVELGDHYIPGLARAQDREKAARHTLGFLADGGFGKPWLLIFDNVDDPRVLDTWRPRGNVKTLITSRLGSWGRGVAPVEIREWPMADAVRYLLDECESARPDLVDDDAQAIAEALGCLPLALSHAAAYLRDNKPASAKSYPAAIAAHMREAPADVAYDRAVYATFMQQVEQAEVRSPGASAVLSLAAFYAPDEIPEELFTQPLEYYPAALAEVLADPLRYEKAIGALDKLSLVEFAPDTRTFRVHRLVQAAARDALATQRDEWVLNAVGVAFAAFPEPKFDTWSECERLVAHVRAVATHVSTEKAPRELAWLLSSAATYLQERAALADVLPLYQVSLAIRERLAKADPGNVGWQSDLSISHNNIGDVLRAQGNLSDALVAYQASLAISERLAQADPGNAGWQRDLSISQERIGDVLRDQGDLSDALVAYQASLAISERLAQADPGNACWQRDLSVSLSKIGDVLRAQGNFSDALVAYQAFLAISERLAQADPGNVGWQRNLSVSQERIGNVLRDQGNLSDALTTYRASLTIRERLAQADPANADWQRDLSVSQINIGDVLRDQGNLSDALVAYQASLAISEHLAQADPGNADWQRDLSVSQEKIGGVLRDQGNLSDALVACQASLAISERLAKADPGNAGWQRDLSVSLSKIGDVLSVQGNLSVALPAYQASLTIRERLAQADPGNAGWQCDLSVSQEKIGDVLSAQGNLSDALVAYQASLAIRERLAQADPGDAGWQRNLSVSQERIGNVLHDQANLSDALVAYQASLTIRERLAQADPGNSIWQRDLSVSQGKIGNVLRDQGNLSDAFVAYQASLAISERLIQADPGNAIWQRDLSVSQVKIGTVLRAQGNLSDALVAYQASLAISERLIQADPGNAAWQRDVALSYGRVASVDVQRDERRRALDAFLRGREIIARLCAQSPGNATLLGDLNWFDQQIAAVENV